MELLDKILDDLFLLKKGFLSALMDTDLSLQTIIAKGLESISFYCNSSSNNNAHHQASSYVQSPGNSTSNIITDYLIDKGISDGTIICLHITLVEFTKLFAHGLNNSTQLLKEYMPTVLKCIHKSSNFEMKLRTIPIVCSKLFSQAKQMIDTMLDHFKRPSIVLDLEKNDLNILCKKYEWYVIFSVTWYSLVIIYGQDFCDGF